MKRLLAFFADPAERLMALIGPALWWLTLFFALPLAIMVVISVAQRGPYGIVHYNWTWDAYVKASDATAKTAAAEAEDGAVVKPPEPPSRSGYTRYVFQNYIRAFDGLYVPIYVRSI